MKFLLSLISAYPKPYIYDNEYIEFLDKFYKK